MLGRMVGEGGRGFGVDREEQASGIKQKYLVSLSDLAFLDIDVSLN